MSHRLLLILLAVAAVFASAAPAHAALPGLNGKIAFSHDPGNPGTSRDIYVFEPDGSGQTPITGLPDDEGAPAWSPDGTKIAFVRNSDIFVMNADGTGAVNLTNLPFGANGHPSWSPDGTKIAFVSTRSGEFGQNIYTMNSDGSDVTRVTTGTPDHDPAWSPDGLRIAFVRGSRVYTVKIDGSDVIQVTTGPAAREPNWSPSGARIAYAVSGSSPATTGIHTIDPDGSNDVDLTAGLTEAHHPAWSPDGTKMAAVRNGQVWTMNANGTGAVKLTTNIGNNSDPDWQPLPFPGYPRPRGATPLRLPLVPAFTACASPDRTHGPPLAFGSCSSPTQTSPHLTVGTPDANGAAANSIGSVRMRVAPGAPGPPNDTQVWIDFEMTDVRCAAATTACGNTNTAGGPDYTGELELQFTFQATDKLNGPSNTENATMTDYTFHMPEPCSQTADVSTGANCGRMNFSMDAVVPGIVLNLEGKRAIWQIGQVHVYDGGADGEAGTTGDNSLFAVQGVFVP